MLSDSPSVPRLLVVEHDTALQELLVAFLTSEGYGVSLATSPAEALALLDTQTFHLILTDLFSNDSQDRFAFVDQLRSVAKLTPHRSSHWLECSRGGACTTRPGLSGAQAI